MNNFFNDQIFAEYISKLEEIEKNDKKNKNKEKKTTKNKDKEDKNIIIYAKDIPGTLMGKESDPWNLNNLNSVLTLGSKGPMPGISESYIYLGSRMSTFAWHLEDENLYSLNLMHYGERKFWYIIHPEDNEKFETFVKTKVDNFCKNPLRHKYFICHPNILKAKGIRITRVSVLIVNEFIIL